MSNIKQQARDHIDDLTGRTYRCNTDECSTLLTIAEPEDENPEECDDCNQEMELLHPADFILSNPLMEPVDETIEMLLDMAEEEYSGYEEKITSS